MTHILARRALLVPVAELEKRKPRKLAFDHNQIVRDALERARAKLEYETVATRFCETEFTMTELRRVYEIVWNCSAGDLDAGNFQRKVKKLEGPDGFVEDLGRAREGSRGRPAQLYRAGAAKRIHPPLIRPHRD